MRVSAKFAIKSLMQYVVMAATILSGQCIWIRMNYQPGRYVILSVIEAVALVVLLFLEGKLEISSFYRVIFLWLYLLVYIILSPFDGDVFLLPLRFALPLSMLVLYMSVLWRKEGIYDFAKKYANIIVVIAFISLVMYVGGPILQVFPSHEVSYFWADKYMTCKTYYNLLYETQNETFFGMQFVRNCAIFCEAPSYAVPLVLSLFFEIFVARKRVWPRIIILMLATATSFSTKAMLILAIILALKLFQIAYIQPKRRWRILRLLGPILIILVSYAGLLILEQKVDSNSFVSRLDNLQCAIKAFRDNWLLGVGAGNEQAVSVYSRRVLRRYGFSIGAPLLLAEGGVYLTAFFLFSFVRGFFCSKNRYLALSLFVTYFAVLFSSNIVFFLSTVFMLALGYSIPRDRRQRRSGSARIPESSAGQKTNS